MSRTPTVVVLGMMTKMPVAGVVWQTVHYLEGFRRLGYDVHYVETHARTPSMLMAREDDDGSALAAAFIDRVLRRFGLGDRWTFVALHDDGRHFGTTERELARIYGAADAIINLHGGTQPLAQFAGTGRLVYLETDPVQLQVELHDGLAETIEFLAPHSAFFTFGENLGATDCELPLATGYDFRPTRQPVLTDLWAAQGPPAADAPWTTVGNWRQHWRDVTFGGRTYTWSKHHEWSKVLDVPARTGVPFELALSGCEDEDRSMLQARGWGVVDGLALSREIDDYRAYVQGSRGEFTVAKEQNVRFRTGWFSDRSATYLAAGRPVVTQDTGFGAALPTGEGLLPFTTLDDALAAVEAVERDPGRHRAAASEVARTCFDSDVVLGRLLEDLGLPRRAVTAFPVDLRLTPVARRPLRLDPATVDHVLAMPPARARLEASVVVVTFGELPVTKLCLESVLATTDAARTELVVVDNGSSERSREYLRGLERRAPNVRVAFNDGNAGFARATNRGLAAARGDALVLLNNDTIVPPGWLDRLLRHLEDPAVGLVGPVTNRCGTEAEIPTAYETYGEMLALAAERAAACAGRRRPLPTPTMFCLALRRATFERLGPLDERFEVGMLEDDDYAMRARRAGLQAVTAEDVFVHHFGEATFGDLVPVGEHARLLEANKRRFEEKWGEPWRPYGRRPDDAYDAVVDSTRAAIERHVPAGGTVAVVSRGDDRLLDLAGRVARHFPQTDGGAWAGHHPGDSDDAVRLLRRARDRGVGYLAVPRPMLWWLRFYEGLAEHLEREGRALVRSEDCVIYELERKGA